jgi:hypothetical protein
LVGYEAYRRKVLVNAIRTLGLAVGSLHTRRWRRGRWSRARLVSHGQLRCRFRTGSSHC